MRSLRFSFLIISLCSASSFGQWESGSDGSDGPFAPLVNTQVDLSLAIPGDALLTTTGNGNGVYDSIRGVVCFKYTTINVPANVNITFGMHPSGAPVVWLAQLNVTINGRVNLDGEDHANPNPPIIPYYTRPGPGGFEGGQAYHAGAIGASFGLGPGSSATHGSAGATHASDPPESGGNCCPQPFPIWIPYGNDGGMPLMGGSGGNANGQQWRSGGAGGGAILIAAPNQITLGPTGSITAQGGDGAPFEGGGGSGGTIRLRAATVTLAAGSQVNARGGIGGNDGGCGGTCGYGGNGRVRIEATDLNNNPGTITGVPSFPGGPSLVFPTSPPRLFVISVNGQSAPADPKWGIKTADIDVHSAGECTVNIGAFGIPAGVIVKVRAIPLRGDIITANSTPLVGGTAGATATALVTFPPGKTELQLKANWP